MNDSRRLGIIAVALVLLWVVTYWLTDRPSEDPFAIKDGAVATAPDQPLVVRELPPAEPEFAAPPRPEPPPPEPKPEPKEAPTTGVIPPSFRMYTIERGDTPTVISQKIYGTSKHWRAVQQANPLTDFSKIKVGREIRVPVDPENIQGLPVTPEPEPAPEPGTVEPQHVDYIVESGDTLSGIARSLYGKSALWTLIRDANRDKLNEDGTNLKAGMVLKIPPAPQGAR